MYAKKIIFFQARAKILNGNGYICMYSFASFENAFLNLLFVFLGVFKSFKHLCFLGHSEYG